MYINYIKLSWEQTLYHDRTLYLEFFFEPIGMIRMVYVCFVLCMHYRESNVLINLVVVESGVVCVVVTRGYIDPEGCYDCEGLEASTFLASVYDCRLPFLYFPISSFHRQCMANFIVKLCLDNIHT